MSTMTVNVEEYNALLAKVQAMEKQQTIDSINAAPENKHEGLSIRISPKGAVAVYGLGRWPVTLYAGQWRKLLAIASHIVAFCNKYSQFLAVKESADENPTA